jgi:hypothetical protein
LDVVADFGPERPPEAVLEQAWPRRAPRVLLGFEVLRHWLTRLLRDGRA